MIPYKQLYRHDPDSGIYGDCYRTAIGCLLHIPPADLPHFCEPQEGDETGNEWLERRDWWLAEHAGVAVVDIYYMPPNMDDIEAAQLGEITGPGLLGLLRMMEVQNPGLYYILGGTTPDGIDHVVVCCGGKIIHNPSLDNNPIVGPISGGEAYHFLFLVPAAMLARWPDRPKV